MLRFFKPSPGDLQPDERHMYKGDHAYEVDMRRQAAIIGSIACILPFALIAISWPFTRYLYDSLSHTYYGSFSGGVFVITLAIVGSFLLAYRGANPFESNLATAAGVAALLTAYFPTSGSGLGDTTASQGRAFFVTRDCASASQDCVPTELQFWLLSAESKLHYGAAAFLFAFLFYYSAVVFTRQVKRPKDQPPPSAKSIRNKMIRNRIYIACAGIILLSVVGLLAKLVTVDREWLSAAFWDDWNATYVFESTALIAFGFSWMVKGRFFLGWLADEDEPRTQQAT